METETDLDLEAFTSGYVACALWADGTEWEELHGNAPEESDLAAETLAEMREDCAAFLDDAARELIGQAMAMRPRAYDWSSAGHDFWLTRCGHGAGFWDRGLGKIGDKLTEASKAFGNVDLCIGDDGRIYASQAPCPRGRAMCRGPA